MTRTSFEVENGVFGFKCLSYLFYLNDLKLRTKNREIKNISDLSIFSPMECVKCHCTSTKDLQIKIRTKSRF